ncbi:MAG: hypothetical protein ACTSYA_00950 [Candidatus Kariarchaeaceae archaeon]
MVAATKNSSAQLRWADKFQNERRTPEIISMTKEMAKTIIGKLTMISEKEKKQVNTAMKRYEEMGMSLPIARIQ